MLAPILSLAVLLDLALGVDALSKRFVERATHEERYRLPGGWMKHSAHLGRVAGRAAPSLDKKNFVVPMRFHLTQRNLENAHDFLMDVADPHSPNFGKHWTSKEVEDAFAPSQDSVDDIYEWLADAGIDLTRVKYNRPKAVSIFDKETVPPSTTHNVTFLSLHFSRLWLI